MLTNTFVSLEPKNVFSLTKAFSVFAADLQMLVICSLKFKRWSIVIPNKLTIWISPLLICIFSFVWFVLFLPITKALNLSRLTNISFLVNHSIAHSDSDYRISFSLSKVFAKLRSVLSSAKLWTVACLMKKKKSWKNANKIVPTTEPCGTPEIISLKTL